MRLRRSKFKIQEGNCRPSRRAFDEAMEDIPYTFVDLHPKDADYCRNDDETIVIRLGPSLDFWVMASYTWGVANLRPDVYSHIWLGDGSLVVRMWWD